MVDSIDDIAIKKLPQKENPLIHETKKRKTLRKRHF